MWPIYGKTRPFSEKQVVFVRENAIFSMFVDKGAFGVYKNFIICIMQLLEMPFFVKMGRDTQKRMFYE